MRAVERSWRETTTLPAGSGMAETPSETKWVPILGVSIVMPNSDTEWPPCLTCSTRARIGLSGGSNRANGRPASAALPPWKNCSAAGLR